MIMKVGCVFFMKCVLKLLKDILLNNPMALT